MSVLAEIARRQPGPRLNAQSPKRRYLQTLPTRYQWPPVSERASDDRSNLTLGGVVQFVDQ